MSFLGLRTEFPIIICSLVTGTNAIIGTDVLGSVLPHTLDIKNGLLFAQGGASLQLHRRDSALSGRVFTVGHSSIPPYSEAVLHCSVRTTGGRALPSSGLLVADDRIRPRGVTGELPYHLQDLVDQTSGDLDGGQRCRLAEVLLEYADIFPVPGDPPVTRMRWNTTSIRSGRPSGVPHVACHLRR